MAGGKKRPRGFPIGWFPDHSVAIAKMSTKNVMSPLLVGSGVLVSLLLVAAVLIEGPSREILVWLVVVVVVFVLFAYTYFALSDPDRLQSEEYAVARQHLELLRESGKQPTTIDLTVEQTPNFKVEDEEVSKIDGN